MSEHNSKKETIVSFCKQDIEIKETIDGEFYSEGFIATTHPDRAAEGKFYGDVLSKKVLKQICDFINSGVATIKGVGSTRTVSKQHDWIHLNDPETPIAGMAMPPAEIRETGDGHYGVWVKTHHNKMHPEYDEIKYNVIHGYYPGYSIEYAPGDYKELNIEGKTYRLLESITNFVGYAFAGARKIANPAALISGFGYKEIENEVKQMSEEVKVEESQLQEEQVLETTEEVSTQEETTEQKEEEVEQKEVETPESEETESKEEVTEEEEKVESKEVSVKEIVDKVIESKEYKEALDNLKVEPKVIKTKESKMENITIKEMNSALEAGNINKYKTLASTYVSKEQLIQKALADPSNFTRGFQSNLQVKAVGKGLVIAGEIQTKDTLVVGDNPSSFTQSNVEFADVFAPGIIDTFNNQINLFGFLKKEQHVGGNYYQWKMITNRDPAGNDTFVGQDDVNVAKNFSSKLNYQTPLKIARRGVSVSDFVRDYSASSLGDLFQLELDVQMKYMMKQVNAAIFAEVADGTGNAPLGLEAVADSDGNTTIYGLTRSTANRLSPDAAADTYLAVGGALTEAALRAKIKQLEVEGTALGDIAIVASPNTRDYLFNLLDGNRRFNTVEASFGFNKMNVPSFDGFPIIVDPDCNSDAIYVIDTSMEGAVIVVGKEPRITELAKVGAATEAYIQMDFAFVYKQPRRIGMLDTLSS